MPKEIVYDQDKVFLVDENAGDFVFTKEFTKYRYTRHFEVYMCRKADPETKGMVENVVKYVKYNFAKHRKFVNIDKWNELCLSWLERRGNGKKHQKTHKIPTEVFEEEKKYLRPLEKNYEVSVDNSIEYQVRKTNVVPIEGNRYSVPLGTYKGPNTYVKVIKTDSEIIILDKETGVELNRCTAFDTKGNLHKNPNHKRERKKAEELFTETLSLLGNTQSAKTYLEHIRSMKSRYIRDQLIIIKNCSKNISTEIINKTIEYCENNKFYSANDYRDILKYFAASNQLKENVLAKVQKVSLDNHLSQKANIKPKTRSIDFYKEILDNQIH